MKRSCVQSAVLLMILSPYFTVPRAGGLGGVRERGETGGEAEGGVYSDWIIEVKEKLKIEDRVSYGVEIRECIGREVVRMGRE